LAVESAALGDGDELDEFLVRTAGIGQGIADDIGSPGEQFDEPGLFGSAVAGHGIRVWHGTMSTPTG
jgi:hypothetical protein